MGSAKFTFGAIALLLGLGVFGAVGWHFFHAPIPGISTWTAIGGCGIGLWLFGAGGGFLREAFAGEPASAAEVALVERVRAEGAVAQAVEEHVEADAALLLQLAGRGVDLDAERAIDLHFFAPDEERAKDLAARLQADLGGAAKVGPPRDDGEVGVELTIQATPKAVAEREHIEHRVRTALRFDATHDGWGTRL
ncbi:MAG: ribonuclease E inhibitor RraB [Planctomycetes bacterium]|nr:ribonuclease E inhibitor RraB [Planctomycetota bacterium]